MSVRMVARVVCAVPIVAWVALQGAQLDTSPDGAMGEGIAIDAAGNLYTAEATVRGITKYVKE